MGWPLEIKHSPDGWKEQVRFIDLSIDELISYSAAQRLRSHRTPVWVLDLDSTLFHVFPRTQRIIEKHISELSQHDPHIAWILKRLHRAPPRYYAQDSFEILLLSSGLNPQVAKELAYQLWIKIEDAWYRDFFSSSYLFFDEVEAGAQNFVHRIYELNITPIFLTGRDHQRMGLGTLQVLRHHGFWKDGNCRLIMKRDLSQNDILFKQSMIKMIASGYDIIGAIDNEIELVLAMNQALGQWPPPTSIDPRQEDRLYLAPHHQIVFFESTMSNRIPHIRELQKGPILRLKTFSGKL